MFNSASVSAAACATGRVPDGLSRATRASCLPHLRCVLLLATLASNLPQVHAFSPSKPLALGWQGTAKLGAHSINGGSDSRQMLLAGQVDYRSEHFENQLDMELLRVSSDVRIKQLDTDGEALVDERGAPRYQKVKTRTADRRYIGFNPQWFFYGNSYTMLILDYEQNEPEGLEAASRRIGGFGHRLWNSKDDLLAAEVGAGSRRLQVIGSEASIEKIGYVGLMFTRDLSEKTRMSVELDADFGSDSRYTQLKLGWRYKITRNIALRLKYSMRSNHDSPNSRKVRSAKRDSETALYLEFDLF